MTRLIHLDTDIGGDTDDLCALVMLLGWPDLTITGITTVTDEGGVRAGMAHYVLGLVGREDVPVVAGAAGSLAGFHETPGIGDIARYWPEPIVPRPALAGAALALLEASINSGATVVAIGPATNLALLEAARPGLLASARLVLMGGYLAPLAPGLPPWGTEMDWNIQADTLAARIVFERCDPILVPIDVTLRVTLRAAQIPSLRARGPLGRLLADQAEAYASEWGHRALARQHAALPEDLLNFQHDALACAVAAGWDGVTVDTLPLLPGLHDRWLTFTPTERAGRRASSRAWMPSGSRTHGYVPCCARRGKRRAKRGAVLTRTTLLWGSGSRGPHPRRRAYRPRAAPGRSGPAA